uniref:Uncharacterized protein n=1 Tax=Gadus morhua TaxID=8049 RepID=A0A8C5BCD2_GADMO
MPLCQLPLSLQAGTSCLEPAKTPGEATAEQGPGCHNETDGVGEANHFAEYMWVLDHELIECCFHEMSNEERIASSRPDLMACPLFCLQVQQQLGKEDKRFLLFIKRMAVGKKVTIYLFIFLACASEQGLKFIHDIF